MIYPHLITFTNRFVRKGFAGKDFGPFIFIRPDYMDDVGLIRHELVHVKQFWTEGLFIHSIRYQFSKQYRLDCEVEAYKEQLNHYPEGSRKYLTDLFAGYIANKYRLDVSKDQAKWLLEN